MSYFDEADSENREKKEEKKIDFARVYFANWRIWRILHQGIKRFHISRKGLKFAKSQNFTLVKFYSFKVYTLRMKNLNGKCFGGKPWAEKLSDSFCNFSRKIFGQGLLNIFFFNC